MNNSTISPLRRALADLESERNTIDAAIVSLRGLINDIGAATGRAARRRGRPAAKTTTGAPRKPKWSAAARKAAAIRMKKRWDERRKVKAKSS